LGSWGNIGNGAWSDAATPTAVSGGFTYTAISSGQDYTCAPSRLSRCRPARSTNRDVMPDGDTLILLCS